MSPVKLTNAPEGFEYYKVCDPQGVCRVVRGFQEAQRVMKETPGLTATKYIGRSDTGDFFMPPS